jgi:branched-chain amino acid transport system ATP-binding protein
MAHAAEAQALLTVAGVSMAFGGVQALSEVSLEVRQGEVLAVIGPNGAGKTTLFNVIYGLKPMAGRILFRGEDITGLKPYDICHKGIARTFQLTRPFLDLSALDNVAAAVLFGRRHQQAAGLREARREALDVLRSVKLEPRQDALARDLLFAERRRLELARALATGPDMVLLDEVMAGLSVSEAQEMLDILHRLRQQRRLTLLIIEHVMRVVMAVCDRIVVLNYGHKLAEGAPQDVVGNPAVIEAYLGGEDAAG